MAQKVNVLEIPQRLKFAEYQNVQVFDVESMISFKASDISDSDIPFQRQLDHN